MEEDKEEVDFCLFCSQMAFATILLPSTHATVPKPGHTPSPTMYVPGGPTSKVHQNR